MNRLVRTVLCAPHVGLLLGIGLLAGSGPATAQAQVGEQMINLSKGWNALWLEVEPTYANGHPQAGQPMHPEDVFGLYPEVRTVASPRTLAGLAEFFGDAPTNGLTAEFNQEGWEQWHNPAGLLDDLVTLQGNRPYIMEATAPASITLQGEARFFRPTWTADRFNLIGFGIDAASPPTFSQFFGPAGARHPVGKIYALGTDGNWSVVGPGALMRNDEAYWIYCNGASDYMGPVAVAFDGMRQGMLNFGGPVDVQRVGSGVDALELDLEEVTFSNLGTAPVTPRLVLQPNLVEPSELPGDLTLYEAEPETNSLSYRRGAAIGANFVFGDGEQVAARATAYLTIGARRNWSAGRADRFRLYRLTTGAGSAFWLPVRVQHDDLQYSGVLPPATPDLPGAPLTGLWVGEVIADQVTSIVEDGAPVRPAAASVPLRLLLHTDSNGVVRLLSSVTFMQTRTASPEITPEPVLVVDTGRIPYFEGIKQRRGKPVGLRLESVTIDMPRKLDSDSQAALLAVTNLAGEVAIQNYLESRSLRPPALAESYHLTWPLGGALGAGQTVRTTAAAPLVLDPFHRANPFRHPYHQQLPRGPTITRALELVFDAEQPVPGRLRGRYQETITGLIKNPLVINGSLELRQVSAVANLEGAE